MTWGCVSFLDTMVLGLPVESLEVETDTAEVLILCSNSFGLYPKSVLMCFQHLGYHGSMIVNYIYTIGPSSMTDTSHCLVFSLMGCMIFCWLGLPLLACNSGPGGGSLHWCMSYSFPGHLMGCST